MPHAGKPTHLFQYVDDRNSTTTPLNDGETFTGAWVETLQFPTTMIALTADQDCDYKIQFSPDTTNIDSTVLFDFRAGNIEPPKRITNTRRYYRIVVENNSGANMTYLRLQTILGHHPPLNAPLNAKVTQDSDAVVARSLPFQDEIALGRYQNISLWSKFGVNRDIDSGTVPEDIWTVGGIYTGFPSGAAEEFQIVLSDASDVGNTVKFYYLPTFTSTQYVLAEVVTTGLTTNTGVTGVRSNRGVHTDTAANVGTITLRHAPTTANVFWRIEIGIGQTETACFTVPANNKGLIRNVGARVSQNKTAFVDGAIWIQELGEAPRLLGGAVTTNSAAYSSHPYGGLLVQGFADIALRALAVSTNDVTVYGDFSIVLVDED